MTVIWQMGMAVLRLVALRMDLFVLLQVMAAIVQAVLEELTLMQHIPLAYLVQITIARHAIQRGNASLAILRINE
jgi:hypothetical protein